MVESNTQTVQPDLFPPGAKVCFMLLRDKSLLEELDGIFRKQGYYTVEATDPEQGLAKLRLNQYQVVLIQDHSEHQELLEEIGSWPGQVRRSLNLILIGENAPSMHQEQALVKGANFYLNSGDRDNMEQLIRDCLKGYQLYYHPWNKVLEEMDAG